MQNFLYQQTPCILLLQYLYINTVFRLLTAAYSELDRHAGARSCRTSPAWLNHFILFFLWLVLCLICAPSAAGGLCVLSKIGSRSVLLVMCWPSGGERLFHALTPSLTSFEEVWGGYKVGFIEDISSREKMSWFFRPHISLPSLLIP